MRSSAVKIPSTVTVVRGKRGRPHSNANAIRNRIVRTSEIPTAPATSQCTFSQVAQNSVARNSVPVIFMPSPSTRAYRAGGADGRAGEPARPGSGIASDASRQSSEELGELLDARAAPQALAILRREPDA